MGYGAGALHTHPSIGEGSSRLCGVIPTKITSGGSRVGAQGLSWAQVLREQAAAPQAKGCE